MWTYFETLEVLAKVALNGKHTLHHLCYLVSLTIWGYTVLYLFIENVKFYQAKSFIVYGVQTTY